MTALLPPDPNPQTGAWLGVNESGTYLVRLYRDGSMTAEFKDAASGCYSGEVRLSPEVGWWDETPARLQVVS